MNEGTTQNTAEGAAESTASTITEATCRRELDLEIPAEEVQGGGARGKGIRQGGARARLPSGKAPITLMRRRFADDIKGEVLQSLVPRTHRTSRLPSKN